MMNISPIRNEYDEIDLRSELVRIDRDRAETHKLFMEAEKFRAQIEIWRSRWAIVLITLGALIGAVVVKHL
jgi:hypothetical protein